MNELLQVIKGEVEARELSEGIKVCELKKSEGVNRQPPVPTASALVVRKDNPNVCIVEAITTQLVVRRLIPLQLEKNY